MEGAEVVTSPGGAVRRESTFGVDQYGPVDLATGLGASARGFVRGLQAAGVPVHIIPTGHICGGHTPVDAALVSDHRRFPLSVEHINADTTEPFQACYGAELTGLLARAAVWYWELPAFPAEWVPHAHHYDEIWVASQFGRRAVGAATRVPVHVVPPSIALAPVATDSGRELFGLPADAFVFLYVFDHTSFVDRKNPFCLVDAFVSEFGGEPEVRLVLKVSHAHHDAPAFLRLREATEEHSNITVLAQMLGEAELAALFECADCYVSPHRTEGFGLTVAEAMLRGTPVIATGYGATADFLNAETGFPLEYELTEIERSLGPYRRGHLWADPSREHLSQLLRLVASDRTTTAARAAAGRRFVQAHYSAEAAGARMRDRLEALMDGGARA